MDESPAARRPGTVERSAGGNRVLRSGRTHEAPSTRPCAVRRDDRPGTVGSLCLVNRSAPDEHGDSRSDDQGGQRERHRDQGVDQDEDSRRGYDGIDDPVGVLPDRQHPNAEDERRERDRVREGRPRLVQLALSSQDVDLNLGPRGERSGRREDEVVPVAVSQGSAE